MRRAHYLKPNHGCEMPHECIWVDTETNAKLLSDGSERHELDFGYAAYSRTVRKGEWIEPQWIKFNNILMFWEWVTSRLHGKSKLYIFAHNWAFDAPVLDVFNVLPELGFKLHNSVIQSPPVILKWRCAPHSLMLIDTLNIWRMPLAKLGESIGLPKLKMPDKLAPQSEWDTYAKRDVEIIMRACLNWFDYLKSNDLGGFAPTLASQAVRTFRHKFMSHKILIDSDEKALALARNSLHGGRTECFYLGKVPETIYKLDANSQYPAIMRTKFMPRQLLGHYTRPSVNELSKWLDEFCLTIKAHIKTSLPVYPVNHNDRLTFVTGEYIGYLSTPEIEYAIEHDLIVEVYEVNIYERDIIFRDYIDYFYNERLKYKAEGDETRSLQTKLLMNSLFGKFAQRGIMYTKVDDTRDASIKVWTEIDAETGDVFNYRQYAHIIEELQQEGESRDSHPAIAAHITAHARTQVWGWMLGSGLGNYYYCDTDSIWVNKSGYERLRHLIDDNELGMLKCEGVHDNVWIYGPKDYIIDNQVRIKGIRSKARKVDDNVFEQDKFSSLIGLLRYGDMSAPIVKKQIKHLKRQYNKGIVQDDGWIIPLTVRDA